ncbi:MAG: CoA-binding protein [Bacteroidota bacterium]
MSKSKKTIVIGASPDPSRFSYKAVKRLTEDGHPVIAIGNKEGEIEGIKILNDKPNIQDVHTVTMYLNSSNQAEYVDYIINMKPKRVIFNPGSENDAFAAQLKQKGIEVDESCTLVMLSTELY